jgi:tRNA (cmo5U34)-methyltransferase
MASAEWTDAQRAERWIERREEIPGQQEVARVVFQDVIAGRQLSRILDLGTGDGRVLAGLRLAFPKAEAVGLDFSRPMLEKAEARFADDLLVRFIEHDLNDTLPADLGSFDLVISAQAIHHLPDERKRALYREAFDLVAAGGVFCNIDLVALPTEALFKRAMQTVGVGPEDEDPTDQPAAVEPQLAWLREAGFANVDCYWKWLAGAVLVGERPA